MAEAAQVVRAGGGLVVRRDGRGTLELLLVHRPRYDDWTFPKGKAGRGESDEDCALREVEEETGLRCALGLPLGSVEYTDALGRPKVVRFWTMRPLGGRFAPGTEVDETRWVTADGAHELLSYDRERAFLPKLTSGPLFLVRHASAGDPLTWIGDDRLRPLDDRGRRQSDHLADVLAGAGVERLLSSPYLRCVQTLEPLAERLGLEIEHRDELAEGAEPDEALSVACRGAVLCTHGDVGAALHGDRVPKKGSAWRLELGPAAPAPVERLTRKVV